MDDARDRGEHDDGAPKAPLMEFAVAVLSIRRIPDPMLRTPSVRVPADQVRSRDLQRLVDDMIETMRDAGGVGLAAPQIGRSLRLAVIELAITEQGHEGAEPLVLFNPEVVRRDGGRQVLEGCLSVPGRQGTVRRCERVVAKGLDRTGTAVRHRATALLAQALEHEIDHLNGVLYLDRLTPRDGHG